MIDEFFANNAIKDYLLKAKINGESLKLDDNECEAVISMLSKGKSEYLHLLYKIDESLERSNQIKSLFLARVAIEDVKIKNLSKEKAIDILKSMTSDYAKDILEEIGIIH